jgi:ATP-dependent DNA helicase Rep
MAYLRLLANPQDDAAFLRVVNTPRREIGPATLEHLATFARERQIPLVDACDAVELADHLSARQRERLVAFRTLILDSARRAEREPVGAMRELLDQLEYSAWLREQASSHAVAERRFGNVSDLLEWLDRLRHDELRERSLADMAAHLTLMDVLERQDEADSGDRVSLMTLHAAKGLEFPHVFLVGMEEDLLPHRSSIEDDCIEEERRLAYVGITRAQRTLTFTLTRRRKRYGAWVSSEPSRVVVELPPADLDWDPDRDDTPENRKARGLSHLHALKGMLDLT